MLVLWCCLVLYVPFKMIFEVLSSSGKKASVIKLQINFQSFRIFLTYQCWVSPSYSPLSMSQLSSFQQPNILLWETNEPSCICLHCLFVFFTGSHNTRLWSFAVLVTGYCISLRDGATQWKPPLYICSHTCPHKTKTVVSGVTASAYVMYGWIGQTDSWKRFHTRTICVLIYSMSLGDSFPQVRLFFLLTSVCTTLNIQFILFPQQQWR